MKSYWNAFRRFNRDILLYLVYWCMIAFAYFGVMGVLLNLYLLRLGYGPQFIGLLIGSGQLVWAVFSLPAGFVGSRFGVKRAIIAGMLLTAVSIVLMLFAENFAGSLRSAWLIVTWMLTWIGAALVAVNGAPYLMSVTDDQTRAFAFSAQQTVMAAASFAGSVAAGILPGVFAGRLNLTLDDPAPYRLALILAPLAYLVGALAFSRARPAGRIVQQAESPQDFKAPVLLFILLGLVIAFQSFSEGTVRAFYNVYLDTALGLPTNLIGGIMGVSQLGLVLISLIAPLTLHRWGVQGSLLITTFGVGLFLLLMAWVPTGAGAAISYLGLNGMLTILATGRGIYSQEAVHPRWRTTMSAVVTIGLALGWSTAAWWGGVLIGSIGFQGIFLIGALFALVSAGLLAALIRRQRAPDSNSAASNATLIAVTGKPEEGC